MAAFDFQRRLRTITVALIAMTGEAHAAGGVVVIGHPGIAGLDSATLQRVYTGRVIEINGMPVIAVNASSGSAVRSRFLQNYLNEDEEKYTAYWVVRRYIGKGTPPREISGSAGVINFVKATPGAIGYIEEADIEPGINVLLK